MHKLKCCMCDNNKLRITNEVADFCACRKASGIRSSNRRRLFVGFFDLGYWLNVDNKLSLPYVSPEFISYCYLISTPINAQT